MELHTQDFHLGNFLTATVDMCRIKAEQKGVALVYEPDANLPAAVHADPQKLRQVLINLLGNAAKFTDNGNVMFKATLTEPPMTNSASWRILFQIQDTGVGIRQDQLEKIFRPFEQADNSTRHSEGTGLGLAISRKIVQMMGSDIHVDSELGVGSIFWFEVELLAAREWRVEDELQQPDAMNVTLERQQPKAPQKQTTEHSQPAQSQAEHSQSLPAHAYIMPPASELAALYNAAKTGFMADVIQEAERIKALDERYVPLANRLLELSHQFDDAAILKLVQTAVQEVVVS